jgi:hypothetical protein
MIGMHARAVIVKKKLTGFEESVATYRFAHRAG